VRVRSNEPRARSDCATTSAMSQPASATKQTAKETNRTAAVMNTSNGDGCNTQKPASRLRHSWTNFRPDWLHTTMSVNFQAVPRNHRDAMLRRRRFGDLPDGTSVDVITLGSPGSPGSIEAQVLTYGCVIASLRVPDARGVAANVVL